MMAWTGAIFLTVASLLLLKLFRLVEISREIISLSRESLVTMGSVDLSEAEKERMIQRSAVRALGCFLLLSLGGVGALVLPLALLTGADQLQLVDLDEVLATTFSATFLITSTVVATSAFCYWYVRQNGQQESVESHATYSSTERMIHEVAFGTYGIQAAVSRLEDRLYKKSIAQVSAERPLLITALPRAGTTLLLEFCHASPEFATHTYRDMPFVPTPLLWGQFSKFFAKDIAKRQRAHGDGMMIDVDSPEALEEILWMQFWPEQYGSDWIAPCASEVSNDSFKQFYSAHMRKIVCRRSSDSGTRYASKNNANIARIDWLRAAFPDAVLLVPFRNPLQHAQSLLRQHQNFLAIHREDQFAAEYMKAIGHFDFGVNLRPIDFDGWFSSRPTRDQESLAFWLEYWVAAYRRLLEQNDKLTLFSYDDFCCSGEAGLRDLAAAVGAEQSEALLKQQSRLRAIKLRELDLTGVPGELISEACELHRQLLHAACNVHGQFGALPADTSSLVCSP